MNNTTRIYYNFLSDPRIFYNNGYVLIKKNNNGYIIASAFTQITRSIC